MDARSALTFSYYGIEYTSVAVTSSGFLQFGDGNLSVNNANSSAELSENLRVAPLWDDLYTYGEGDNIFVDVSSGDKAVIYWNASHSENQQDVQFAVVLFADGTIRFDYGPGNTGLSPTIGISAGGGNLVEASYNATSSLANAKSLMFEAKNTFVDLGSYEFQGSTLDTTPPTIVRTELHRTGTAAQIHVLFSEAIDPIDANSPANYELREAGPNGILGDLDDLDFEVLPHYEPGGLLVILDVVGAGALTGTNFQVTVHADSTIHDLSGIRLDGDGDGEPGGNLSRQIRRL